MLLILIPSIGFLACVILAKTLKGEGSEISAVSAVILGMILGVALIVLPLIRMDYRAEIQAFQMTQNTILIARAERLHAMQPQESPGTNRRNTDMGEIELAALQQKVVEANQWLAKAICWANHPLTSWFLPVKAINKLRYIK